MAAAVSYWPEGPIRDSGCHITITCSPPRSSSVKTKVARAREGRGEREGERERRGNEQKSTCSNYVKVLIKKFNSYSQRHVQVQFYNFSA